jgi:hypothetical protein
MVGNILLIIIEPWGFKSKSYIEPGKVQAGMSENY